MATPTTATSTSSPPPTDCTDPDPPEPVEVDPKTSKQNGIMEADGFQIVTNKKRNKPKTRLPFEEYLTSTDTKDVDLIRKSQANLSKDFYQPIPDDLNPLNYALAVSAWAERVRSSIRELEMTDYSTNVFFTLGLALEQLSAVEGDIKEIICYGLGSCVKHWQSRFQLGFLIFLKKKLGNAVPVRLYDPDFTKTDVDVIQKEFGLEVILENEEGNRKVDDLTIFYLPHCPHGLCNNVLRSNWVPHRLGKCIVIGNSFDAVCSSLPRTQLQENVPFILCSSQLCVEYTLGDNYKFFEAFYQMSIHVFPSSLSDFYSPEFWLSEDEVGEKKNMEVAENKAPEVAEIKTTDMAEIETTEMAEIKTTEMAEIKTAEMAEIETTEVVKIKAAETPETEMDEHVSIMENIEVAKANVGEVVKDEIVTEPELKAEETVNVS